VHTSPGTLGWGSPAGAGSSDPKGTRVGSAATRAATDPFDSFHLGISLLRVGCMRALPGREAKAGQALRAAVFCVAPGDGEGQ
jgi:hypothetical protein